MQYVEIDKIITNESPREIIADHFQSLRRELPIRGGWGYSQEDAVIIDKNDPTVVPGMPFDCVGIERIFVEKRIYEELIIFRPENDRFTKIRWELKEQELIKIDNRVYDKIIFSITAWRDADYDALQKERNPEWELDSEPCAECIAYDKKCHELQVVYEREYWFDITSTWARAK